MANDDTSEAVAPSARGAASDLPRPRVWAGMTVRAGSSQEARRVVETALQSAAEDGAISGWEINLEPMNAPEGEWKFGALVFVAADSTDEADKRVQATLDGLVTEDMLDGWWTIGPAALWMPGWSDEGR